MSQLQKTLHGSECGISDEKYGRELIGRVLASGVPGNLFRAPGPFSVVQFNDFVGKARALDDEWTYTEGTDASPTDGAVVVARNGEFLLTGGDSAGTVAADAAQLNSALQWRADSGNLVFQTRVKLASIAAMSCFVGLTDTAALEQPIESNNSGNTVLTTATDAVGFFYDSRMTTQQWWASGVKNDVDAVHFALGKAPVAATYDTLRVEVDIDGSAIFYVNGLPIGTKLANCLTPTVLLTPVFIIRPTTATAGKNMNIDYSYVACDRV